MFATVSSGGRKVADRMVTVLLGLAVAGWAVAYAVLGQFLLRPVSTCGGPEYRCTGLVDLGVGLGSWGPMVVTVVMLVSIASSRARRHPTSPAAAVAVVVVVVLSVVGQALVPAGVVPR